MMDAVSWLTIFSLGIYASLAFGIGNTVGYMRGYKKATKECTAKLEAFREGLNE